VLSVLQVEALRDLQRGLQDYDAQKKNAPGK
jgi:hypothetical protein